MTLRHHVFIGIVYVIIDNNLLFLSNFMPRIFRVRNPIFSCKRIFG